jgi:predicted Ser/Thr protein kinase
VATPDPDPLTATSPAPDPASDSGTLVCPTGGGAVPGFGPPAGPGEVGTLGPYRVLKELGRGGMGAVYLALDTRLNRRLALKVMLPAFATHPPARERFLREARAAATVEHDNVVTVFEADERDGVPYIAMQYLQGTTLGDHLQRHGPTVPQVLRVAEEAAAGLAAAHACGLVHRDIKPANLWLEAPNGRVKVLDFGLARPVEAETELTRSGDVVGTPAYMSPEQARGDKLDHRTDLFSLGAVLYRLCTGKLPFTGPSTMAVLTALGTREPPPVRELNPDVPEPLAALVHQLLAKDPADRPPTADEVVRRVRALAAAAGPDAPDPEGPTRSHAGPLAAFAPIPVEVRTDDAFADLGTTDAEPAPDRPAPRPAPGGRGVWVAAGLAAALAAAVIGGVAIATRTGDGTGTKPGVPDGTAAAAKGKGSGTGAPVPPDPPGAAGTPDQRAAAYVLSIGGTVTVNGAADEIAAAADLPKAPFALTGVYLDYNEAVTGAGLAVFKDCNDLKELHLNDTKITDAGLGAFKNCTGLTTLGLRGTAVTDTGLANFRNCTGLATLGLGHAGVTDDGLAFLKNCTGLRDAYLNGTRVTDAGLAHLAGRTGLLVLSLSDTKVTDAGLAHLAGCTGLTYLHIANTGATDTGLAGLRDLKGLADLNLSGTGVTDASLGTLAGFAGLTKLYVGGTRLSPMGMKKIAAALPRCRVESDAGVVRPKKK